MDLISSCLHHHQILCLPASSKEDIRIDIPEAEEGQHEGVDDEVCTSEEIARIVRERDLISLQKFLVGEPVELRLKFYLEEYTRRSSEEEQAAWTITKHIVHAKDFLLCFLKACKNLTIFLLLVSAALSFTVEMMEQEAKYGWHDGVAILVAVLMLVTFRSVANYRRKRKRQRKLQKWSKSEVQVERRGQRQTITKSSLMVGDILHLKKGDLIPADGFYVNGNGLELDDKLHPKINRQDPFLFSGSEVIDGEGSMCVTSVGAKTLLGRALSLVTPDPDEKTLTEAQIDKTNAYMENVALSTSVLISVLVLINLLFRKQDKKSNILPELKGDVSAHKLIKILEMIFLKPRGKVQILTSALTATVASLQHGMSVVIAASFLHWKKKLSKEEANLQNLSSCGTVGIVSVICFDLTIEQMDGNIDVEQMHGNIDVAQFASQEEFKSAVEALKEAGVSCKLVSKDELPALKKMASELGIFDPASNSEAIEGKDVKKDTTAKMDKVAVIGSCQPEDKIHILQCLKQGGHVVAFIGGMTTGDTPALKEADVGITGSACSTNMARENSDIVISSISSLSPILKIGRCAYGNVQTFIQIQLTASLSGLLVTLVTTIVLDESPITGIHMIWVNCIICILGGLMMVMELQQGQELMNNPPARTESLLTKTMWRNIVIRVLSDASYLLLLQFIGQAIIHMSNDVLKTMIFTVFTLSQVFNQFIAKGFAMGSNALVVMPSSHWFLMAVGAVMAMLVLLVELLKSLADYERLNVLQWGFCFIYSAYLCGSGLAVKYIADSASGESLRSNNSSQYRFPRGRTWPRVSLLWIPFSLFLVASFSYYVKPDIARTFR
ncbi:calcium-transporting ATPase 12, plasma membrane-type-like [Durio zibethinus]|uniref:Calcium-transporting ATPase 12, plasma membrane-type-like n=1 Tax=Durio zibethinus TaxID=66656 RepID=A0A6P6B3Q0_DURZI|nr:calcium-transporting ATPase 12, plasma membrane-type-like [Durio zibethinus]XP_022771679.1 calcium-transporting ATPase 12, plasma membrane-type-like [Durio zibethinus]XP_022771680.1 calcium-transporting ATPase 12, plasma membrane-type-like [Durio zibethinus]XP_022771681.1 calcium-transporting ATPase 12, plasma membrane-type-like [Durio zibethinus]